MRLDCTQEKMTEDVKLYIPECIDSAISSAENDCQARFDNSI